MTFAAADSLARPGSPHVYDPTPTGFRFFVMSKSSKLSATAERTRWGINWLATGPAGSHRTWERDGHHDTLFMKVDAGALGLSLKPTFVVAIAGAIGKDPDRKYRSDVLSGGAVVTPTALGFTLPEPDFCSQKLWQMEEHCKWMMDESVEQEKEMGRWHVNYIAVQDKADCDVNGWGGWGGCDRACGGGRQNRTRSVRVKPWAGGAQCPHLIEYDRCNIRRVRQRPGRPDRRRRVDAGADQAPTPAPTPAGAEASAAPTPAPTPLPTPAPTPWKGVVPPCWATRAGQQERAARLRRGAERASRRRVRRSRNLLVAAAARRHHGVALVQGQRCTWTSIPPRGFHTTPIYLINLDGDAALEAAGRELYSMHPRGTACSWLPDENAANYGATP